MPDPHLTIITPSFNQAQFLESTIKSVLNQQYPNLEYMVFDGGSTDGSVEMLERYEEQLAYWISEPDQGQAHAFNKGLARAKGKYIGWLNSDDLYLPGSLQSAIQLLEDNPGAAFVYGNVQAIDAAGKVTNIMRYGDWQLEDLMCFNIIGQPGVFMRRDLLQKVGGLDPSYHFLLDHHLWLRLASQGPIFFSGQNCAAARFHAAAKNVAQAASFGKEAFRIVEWMKNEPALSDLFLKNQKKIYAGAYRMDARYLLDGGKNRPALKAYWKGLRYDFFTVIPEWHRMGFAVISMMGLSRLKQVYLRIRFLVKRPDKIR